MATIDDFKKVEMKVGTIVEAARIDGADKLLHLHIDIGEAAPRSICSGIAQWYAPEALVGKKCTVVSNLEPRKLRGIESNGMLVCASYIPAGLEAVDANRIVSIVSPDATLPNGSVLS